MDANKALESHTASLLQEPASRDAGPISCSATQLCAAPCAWREIQIWLNKGDTAPVTACIFGLFGTQLFLVRHQPLPEQHLSGFGLRERTTMDTVIDFFCPECFVGNTVLVLTAQNAALDYTHD